MAGIGLSRKNDWKRRAHKQHVSAIYGHFFTTSLGSPPNDGCLQTFLLFLTKNFSFHQHFSVPFFTTGNTSIAKSSMLFATS